MKGKGRIFLKIISFCIIFALLALIGPQLLNAQKSKTKKLPTTKQPPPKGPRIIPFKIWGNVVKDGKAVPNVRIKLTRIQNLVSIKKRVVKPNEVRTDKNGRYSFSIDPKMEGQKYKLMPKHPNFPPGKWLWPQEKEFTLTKSMKIDFKFNPPPLKIKVFSKTASNAFLYRTEVRLHEVRGPHSYRFIESKRGHVCKFELDYNYYGKKIRIQPMHMLLGIYGVGFSPKEEKFTLTGDRDVVFIYSGMLPDLDIIKVKKPRGYIIATIKNIGKLAAGKFIMKISYREYNKTTGENPYFEKERIIDGLKAGESMEVKISVSYLLNIRISMLFIYLDSGQIVVESDETNNKY